jgi:MFS family permease
MGLLYSAGSVMAIIGLMLIPRFIHRFGTRIVMMILVLLTIGVCIVNILVAHPIVIAVMFCLLFASNTMFYLTNDIQVDQEAQSESMGKIRGTYLTIVNVAYVISPLITGFIMARMGFGALYGFAAFILLPLLIFIIYAPSSRHVHFSKANIWHSVRELMQHRDLRNITFANLLLQFFYAWMVIYTPIYLHENLDIPWDSMGTIFSIMLFAFVLTQIPLGKLADRYLGEKPLLIIGFAVMGITTSLLFFLPYFTLPLLALILFATRLGASCVEVLTESYFFKKVPKSETGEMSIFRNTYPLAYIAAPIIAGGVLQVFQVKALFLVLGIIMILGIFLIIPIRNTK